MVDCAILLFDRRFHRSNIEMVGEILRNNCFPVELIDRQINKRLKQLRNNSHNNDNLKVNLFDARRYVSISYIKGLSKNVCHTLNRYDLEIAHLIKNKLNVIIKRHKDKIKMNATELIYKINCADCNKVYWTNKMTSRDTY